MNCNERKTLMKFLLIYDDDYIRDIPYDLNYVLMIMDDLKIFKKGL